MSQSAKKRERTQLFVAQRTKMSAAVVPTPPEEPKKEVRPPDCEETPRYNVHDRPTLPMSHYAALSKDFKFSNPFEREHGAEDEPDSPQQATAHLGRIATMFEDAEPLLLHDVPITTLSSWCIAPPGEPHPPIIAWVQEDGLHLRDERTMHHLISLKERRISTMHHDATYTWFATERGALFRFDRKAKKLVLAHELARQEPIVLIHSDLDSERLIIVSRDGKIYHATPHSPRDLQRTGRSLTSSIACGALNPLDDELILVTTSSKILRIPLATGVPPAGSTIECDQPIVSLHFSPHDRILHVQLAEPDCVQTYAWHAKPKKMFSAALPEGHHGVYLDPHAQHIKLLCSRGNVLLHTTLM